MRLLLLTLTVVALSVIGSTLGYGFNAGVAVVGQAVGPTCIDVEPRGVQAVVVVKASYAFVGSLGKGVDEKAQSQPSPLLYGAISTS